METADVSMPPTSPAAPMKVGYEIVRDILLVALTLTGVITLVGDSFDFPTAARFLVTNLIYTSLITVTAHLVYSRIWVLVSNREESEQWFVFVAVMLVISGASSVVGSLIVQAINLFPGMGTADLIQRSFKVSAIVSLVIGVNEVAFDRLRTKLEDTQLQLKTQELERERTLKLASEARLGALESRLHPHFLFNALNSISSLIQSDPKRAERLVERIAALLRFSLESHTGGLVDLEQELRIVRAYLEIEQARLGPRLRYDVQAEGDINELQLPPLSIQTLVENSIKFVVAPTIEGGEIRVRVARSPGQELQVEVADTGAGFDLQSVSLGHGLDNLRNRLAVLFGEKAALSAFCENGWAVVRMKVPV